jgi:hypothetical protein
MSADQGLAMRAARRITTTHRRTPMKLPEQVKQLLNMK